MQNPDAPHDARSAGQDRRRRTTERRSNAMTADPVEPFVPDARHLAAWPHEVEEAPLERKPPGQDAAPFRGRDGRVAVLEDRRLGAATEGGIRCGHHGPVFDGDGFCVDDPGEEVDRSLYRVRAFPVVERRHFAWVRMGDPDLADEDRIADFPLHDLTGERPFQYGRYGIDANYAFSIDDPAAIEAQQATASKDPGRAPPYRRMRRAEVAAAAEQGARLRPGRPDSCR